MILNRLLLENYKQYSSLELEFREGLVGIIGRNGAGKSTLFEAVLYCLYGKDKNKELLRSVMAEPRSAVKLQLEFSVEETRFCVKRELRGRKLDTVTAEFFKNEQLIAKGANAVTEEVVKVLRLDYDAFKRSVFSGQKELTELSDTKGEQRKKMVRKMLGLERLDDIQSAIASDLRSIKDQIAGQQQNLLNDESLKNLEIELAAKKDALNTQQSKLNTVQKDLELLEKDYQNQKKVFDAESEKQSRFRQAELLVGRLKERLENLAEKQKKLQIKQEELQTMETRLEQMAPFAHEFEQNQAHFKRLEQDKFKAVNRDARLDEQNRYQEEKTAKQLELQTAENELEQTDRVLAELPNLKKRLEETSTELAAKRQEYQLLKEQKAALEERRLDREQKMESIQRLGKDGRCPTCFQPLQTAYDEVLAQLHREIQSIHQEQTASLDAQMNQLIATGEQLNARKTALEQQVQELLLTESRRRELDKQRQSLRKQLGDIDTHLHRVDRVIREIGPVAFNENAFLTLQKELAAQDSEYQQYRQDRLYLEREKPVVHAEAQNTAVEIKKNRTELHAARKALADIDFDEDRFQESRKAFLAFDEKLKQQRLLENQALTDFLEKKNALQRDEDRWEAHHRIASQISAKQSEQALLEKLEVQVRSFKTEMLERVSPGISGEASSLFSRITKGKYESIRVDENFDFFIADGGIFYPIERFSGGEIDLANFCLRIAITKAIMDLNGSGQSVEFLAFDEIFGSQDEDRRHEMMLALNHLQEQFRQIYIVSHIESLRDFFPSILEVQLGENGSRIRWN